MSTVKELPLASWHLARGAKFVPFAGWSMPVQYEEGILKEHLRVREKAGLFDVSHMGEITVRGARAAEFLDYLITGRASALAAGSALYSLLCQEDGGVVDDLIVYRDGPEEFFLCVNAANREKDFAWLRDAAADFGVEVQDVSDNLGLLALQGPMAEKILSEMMGQPVSAAPAFTSELIQLAGFPVRLSRTGYTGEKGFELYVPVEGLFPVVETLWEYGHQEGLGMAGLGCRDSLRLEAGMSLYGHELSATITPLQARLAWTIDWDKEKGFIGQEALQREKEQGVPARVVFFRTRQRRILREGTEVFAGDRKVGQVLSGTLSPVLNEAIGSALVEAGSAGKDSSLAGEIRGTRIALEKVRPPFHK